MARPVCKGFCRDRRLISLLQRIRPRRSLPGQDGDTRAQVLINSSARRAPRFRNSRLPERRLTVRPSRRHPLATSRLHDWRFRSDRSEFYSATDTALARQGVSALQLRPGDPRQLVGQGDDHDFAMVPAISPVSPTGQAACRARPHRAEAARAPRISCLRRYFVAALADPEQLLESLPPVVN